MLHLGVWVLQRSFAEGVARILFVLVGALAGGVVLHAQEPIKSGTGREELTRPKGQQPSTKPQTVYVTRIKPVYVTRNAHPTVTTGTLSVGALPNANILIEPVKGGGVGNEHMLSATENIFIFDKLLPGTYRVAATLDGYKAVEQQIRIFANKPAGVSLKLDPILYTVKIKTNVTSGEVRYAPVEAYTESGTGQKRYRPIGETRLTPIQDHNAVLRTLSKGDYGVDIRASEPGYEDFLGSIAVPDDTNKEEVDLPPVTLKNVRSTETFTALTADAWDVPAGWRIASSLLSTKGKGIAVPHDPLFRYYTDFQLISDARMVNGVAVSFVARASADQENYYLIRLTGANAEEPYRLSGFIVKQGVPQRFQSISVSHLSATLNNKFFKISIKMKGNNIEVKIWDSLTGEYFPLGGFSDSYSTFRIGAVGIAASDKDQAQFGSFIVCTPECPRE